MHAGRVALAVVGIALAGGGCHSRGGSSDAAGAAGSLVTTLGNCRVVEGRVPGAPYAPAPVSNGRCVVSAEGYATAANTLARDRDTDVAPEQAVESAIAHLVVGQRDAAIARLERIPSAHETAPLLTTLAAAYLDDPARGADGAARAVDAAERAVRLDPTRAEAWFNRALALDRLGLTSAATSAWQDYLAHDTDSRSAWAGEARERRASEPQATSGWPEFRERVLSSDADLPDSTVLDMARRAADRCRQLVEDELLRGWAEATLAHGGGSADRQQRQLALAKRLAAALSETHSDRTLLDVVQHVERSSRTASGARRIANGVLAGIRAREAIDRGDAESAHEDLAMAQRAFKVSPSSAAGATAGAGSSAADAVELYSLMADYYRADYGAVIAGLQRLAADAHRRGHLYVEARCTFILAAVAVRQARASDAEILYRRASEMFARGGETGYLASLHAIVSVRSREQGDRATAWNALREALVLLPGIDTPRHLTTVFRTGQSAAVEQQLFGLAVHFGAALVQLSERSHNINVLIPTLADQARQQALTRDVPGATQTFQRARKALSQVPDANVRAMLSSGIARAEAATIVTARPCEAIPLLTGAIDTVAHVVPHQLALTLLERGRAHRACGQLTKAEADLRSGVRVFEEQRSGQRDTQLRISRFDQVWNLYGELIGLLALDRAQTDQALLMSEQSRARVLAEAVGERGDRATPRSLAEIQMSISEHTTALTYIVLPNDLLIWSLTRSSRRFAHVPVRADELTTLITQWRAAVADGKDERPIGLRLFKLLVEPIATTIDRDGLLIVVADGPLHELPMAGLWDGERYLVERAGVWSAPSLSLISWASARLQARPGTPDRLAAIGDPAFSRDRFPQLSRLPDAAREAATVAQLYNMPTVLVGADATKPRILDAMAHAEIVHLAAHAIADIAAPMRSFIVTAESRGSDDIITPTDVERQLRDLPTRLLVLSACHTAAGRIARGEGMLSLARAFMAVGVPVVIANQWDASDRASYPLFLDLHRQLASGRPAAEALRGAQLQSLRSTAPDRRQVRNWANVVGLGATGPIVTAKAAAGAQGH